MTDPRRGHVDTTERRVQVYEHPYCCVSSSVFGDCSSKKRVLNRFVFQNNVTAFTTNPPVSASPGNEVCAVRKNKGRFAVEQLLLCLRFLCEPQSYVPYVQQQQDDFVSSVFAFGLSVERTDIGSFRFCF